MISFLIQFVLVLIILVFIRSFFKNNSKPKVSVSNKTVLVTGAAGGLGRDICLAFAQEHCTVLCVDINKEQNEETVRLIKELDGSVTAKSYIYDVSKLEEVKKLGSEVLSEFNYIDVLVNNAGVAYPGALHDLTDKHVERIININLTAHLWTVRTFLPKMKERKQGIIVAISSVAGLKAISHLVPYCATKFGVAGFMEALNHELSVPDTGVRTLCVYPGFMNTTLLPSKLCGSKVHWVKNALPIHVANTKDVAKDIIEAIQEKKTILYVPKYWKVVCFVFRAMPDFMLDFFKLHFIDMGSMLDPVKQCA